MPYGPWPTVHRLSADRQRLGVWTLVVRLIPALLASDDRLTWTVSGDPSTVRAHRAAVGARKAPVPANRMTMP